jgi:hypothetical protein
MYPVLYLNHDAFQTNKRPRRNPHMPAGSKIDVRFSPAERRGSLKGFDLRLRDDRGNIVKGNQRNYARNPQDVQPIMKCNMNKYVRREQRQKNFGTALFPSTLHLVQGEKSRYAPLSAVFSDTFFVTGTGVYRVPAFFMQLLRLMSTTSQFKHFALAVKIGNPARHSFALSTTLRVVVSRVTSRAHALAAAYPFCES